MSNHTNRSSSSNVTADVTVVEQPSQEVKPYYQVIHEVLPIAVVIVLVNSLVFYLFAKQKKLRTPTNCLLLSLAVCDFMTGFIGIPLFIAVVLQVVKSPTSARHFGFFIVIFNNLMAISAAYHILAITLERYFSIMKPFVHRQLTKKSMLKVALFVWFVSAVIAFMPYAWLSKQLTDSIGFQKTQFGYVVFCLTFVFLVPCVLIVVSQSLMFKTISKRGRCALASRNTSHRKMGHDKKCLIIFAVMAIIYLACWLPWFVISLCFSLWFPISKETMDVLDNLSQVFGIFRFITSVVNPVLYTFFKRDFLDAFKLLVLKKKPVSRNFTLMTQKKTLTCLSDNSYKHMEEREYETVL